MVSRQGVGFLRMRTENTAHGVAWGGQRTEVFTTWVCKIGKRERKGRFQGAGVVNPGLFKDVNRTIPYVTTRLARGGRELREKKNPRRVWVSGDEGQRDKRKKKPSLIKNAKTWTELIGEHRKKKPCSTPGAGASGEILLCAQHTATWGGKRELVAKVAG